MPARKRADLRRLLHRWSGADAYLDAALEVEAERAGPDNRERPRQASRLHQDAPEMSKAREKMSETAAFWLARRIQQMGESARQAPRLGFHTVGAQTVCACTMGGECGLTRGTTILDATYGRALRDLDGGEPDRWEGVRSPAAML